MSDVTHQLFRETAAAKALLWNLADILEGDEQLAADTVEGQTDLNAAIDRAVQQMINDRCAMTGLDLIIDELTNRRARINQRMDHMRTMLAVAMEQAGRKKIEHPAVTLSLRNVPPSVTVTDEAVIPSDYWRPSDPKLDRKTLLAALKEGQAVSGAVLSNGGQTIAVKWG